MPLPTLNETHDPGRRSWLETANSVHSPFPIQNLPFGVFRPAQETCAPRGGIAIGDSIVDVAASAYLLDDTARPIAERLAAPTLQPLMALDPEAWSTLRRAIGHLLSAGYVDQQAVVRHLHFGCEVEMFLPVRPGGFVDFFASIHHATNAGRLFRPSAPLLPNYKHVPIGYNGRASTIRTSGISVRRPHGQIVEPGEQVPKFAPTRRLDFEMELGVFLGGHSVIGEPVQIGKAWRHLFGFCLLNDWSARDIQAWEYQPLGPFLGKSFATTISPWIVSTEALAPFRSAICERAPGDPVPLPHLLDADDQASGAFDIVIESHLSTARVRSTGCAPILLGHASAGNLYWSVSQLIAHQTSNGCNIEPGDLYGTGTVSGTGSDNLGSLLEITQGGQIPLRLSNEETRTFLEDDDEVTISGRCTRDGFRSIGFGTCMARIAAA